MNENTYIDTLSMLSIKKGIEDKHPDFNTSMVLMISKDKKNYEKLENKGKAPEIKDINNKLSDDTQNAIQDVRGTLKSENLLKLLLDVILDKQCKGISAIRRYSDDVEGVRDQLAEVRDKMKNRMEYRKKQEKMDLKLIKKLKELEETIEKEKKSIKTQRSMDEFLTPKIAHMNEVRPGGNKKALNTKNQNSPATLDFTKKAEKRDKKRKSAISKDRVTEIASKISKRFKITSPENSLESMSLGESDACNDENINPISLEDSSSQYDEPMSVGSSTDGSSDAMSIDETRDIVKDKITSPKRVQNNYSDGSSENEKTFSERGFSLRSGRFR